MFAFDTVTANRRAFALGLASLILIDGSAFASPQTTPRVLFVCQFGSVKSPIARELLRRRARARGIAVETFSRGITPEAHLPPAIQARLLADGIDPAREGLRRLRRRDVKAADIVVYFNPLPVGFDAARRLDWTSVPSVLEAYPAALADIEARLEALLDMVAR